MPQRGQLVKRDAERIDISAMIDEGEAALGLLGAHVGHRAEGLAGFGEVRAGLAAGDAEVGDPDFALFVEQQVGGLDVAVDRRRSRARRGGPRRLARPCGRWTARGRRRRRGDGGRRLAVSASGIGWRGAAICSAPEVIEQLAERLAADELHREVVDAALLADGEDGHDVRMVDLGRGLGFVLEAGDVLFVDGGGSGQDLEGDAAAEGDLLRLVDDAHAAAADFADEAEVAELARECRAVIAIREGGGGRAARWKMASPLR